MSDIKAAEHVTVEVQVATSMIKMRGLDFAEQLASDDALSAMLGRQVLALARAKARDAAA